MRKLNKYNLSPEYHRIPHFNREISNMTHDDIELESPVSFPLDCWTQEKVDGANMGVAWLNNGPVVRNREHILSKGYTKIKTPAKKQFTSAWNWVHKHEKDIKKIEQNWESPITIYGEWLFAKHSLEYNNLPDTFLAYDIWSVEDGKYLSPDTFESLISLTNISYIKPNKITFNSISDIIKSSENQSVYRDGIVEGIVIKTKSGLFLKDIFKVVNKSFIRRDDFNKQLIKNTILK